MERVAGQDKEGRKSTFADEKSVGAKQDAIELEDKADRSGSGQAGQRQRALKDAELSALAAKSPPVDERIIVEASPAEIEKLVAACVAEKDYFAATSREELERLGADVATTVPTPGKPAAGGGSGFGGRGVEKKDDVSASLDAAADTAKALAENRAKLPATRQPDSGSQPAGGRAWRLPPVVHHDFGRVGGEVNGKAEQSAGLPDKSSVAPLAAPAGAAGVSGDQLALGHQLAKESQKLSDGKVQVVFVLRREANVAATSAASATGAPAAAAAPAAAPAESSSAKPQP
jgi:hypothetical protein